MIEYFQNDSAELHFKVSLLGLMILTLSSLSLRPRSRGNGDDDGNSISGEAQDNPHFFKMRANAKNVPENVLMLMTNEHFKLVISTVLTLEITKEAVETY